MTAATGQPAALLALAGIERRFGGVHALRGVSLDIAAGKVTALLGENGAGKSTLMKILAGAERPDAGTITMAGRSISPRSVGEANAEGISIVFQELSLFPHLSVGANIFSRREPGRAGIVDVGAMRRASQRLLDRVGSTSDPDTVVGSLNLAERQLVEIAKAMATDARLLILDEPNSALRPAETQRLLEVVRELRDDGVAVVLVSHRLEEVFSIADDIVVLRSGSVVRHQSASSTTISEVVNDMLGGPRLVDRSLAPVQPVIGSSASSTRLRLRNVRVPGLLDDATLEARSGEIVGLAGLEGAGHATVLDALFGRVRAEGRIELPNGAKPPRSERQAVCRGVAYVPSDRKIGGLMLDQSCAENLAHVRVGALGRRGRLVKRADLIKQALQLRSELRIRMPDPAAHADTLSGGNQQKLVVGKWWSLPRSLVLLDDPTRGVDVGGKAEIYRLIKQFAADGRVVLITSSDLLELAELCDRVYVFSDQRVVGCMQRADLNHSALLHAINTGRTEPGPESPSRAMPSGTGSSDASRPSDPGRRASR